MAILSYGEKSAFSDFYGVKNKMKQNSVLKQISLVHSEPRANTNEAISRCELVGVKVSVYFGMDKSSKIFSATKLLNW